jgi:hypothetical protein
MMDTEAWNAIAGILSCIDHNRRPHASREAEDPFGALHVLLFGYPLLFVCLGLVVRHMHAPPQPPSPPLSTCGSNAVRMGAEEISNSCRLRLQKLRSLSCLGSCSGLTSWFCVKIDALLLAPKPDGMTADGKGMRLTSRSISAHISNVILAHPPVYRS